MNHTWWAKKNNEVHFGYKDHVKADADSKFIIGFAVANTSVHDSQLLPKLINGLDRILYADSAYTGKALHASLPEGLEIRIHEKGQCNHPLTDAQKECNRQKSKTRARIKHIFGFITGSMHGIILRSIGMGSGISAPFLRKKLANRGALKPHKHCILRLLMSSSEAQLFSHLLSKAGK